MSAAPITYGTKALGEVSLKVWRAVASAGGKPLAHGAILERLKGAVDSRPLSKTLENLGANGYLHNHGSTRHDSAWRITRKLPLGEEVPPWMQESDTDKGPGDDDVAEPAQVDPKAIGPLGSAFSAARTWPFEGPVIPHPAEPRAKAQPADRAKLEWRAAASTAVSKLIDDELPADAEPLFALYSDNRLMLQLPGHAPLTLPADTTRALFRWLDRLQSATSFAEIATADEAAS